MQKDGRQAYQRDTNTTMQNADRSDGDGLEGEGEVMVVVVVMVDG